MKLVNQALGTVKTSAKLPALRKTPKRIIASGVLRLVIRLMELMRKLGIGMDKT